MGMSASQARYLALQAQKSDLEYQAQQINQERTILSQQVTNLYNSLLAMDVPTPPSTTDFTKTVYQGTLGVTNYSFEASDIRPTGNDTYTINLTEESYGDSANKNTGYATIKRGGRDVLTSIAVPKVETNTETTGKYLKASSDSTSTTYMVPCNSEAEAKAYEGGDGKCYVSEGDVYRPLTTTRSDGAQFYAKVTITDGNPPAGAERVEAEVKEIPTETEVDLDAEKMAEHAYKDEKGNYVAINGNALYTWEALEALGLGDSVQAYQAAIEHANIVNEDGNPYPWDQFLVYFDKDGNANFVLKTDALGIDDTAVSYSYIVNGKVKEVNEQPGCKLTFDPATGRITEISIPVYDKEGNFVSYSSLPLEAVQETDEVAYQKAFADYEYEQTLYEKAQADINAKTEMIQQQDRNLELQLKELDNRRTQIVTEMEALSKVINENIEGSYKTFAG